MLALPHFGALVLLSGAGRAWQRCVRA
jgi:hypothetical protein